jgi:hypothetical protein
MNSQAETNNEVDFAAQERAKYADGRKYGSFIIDIEESIAAADWRQVEKDVAKLRRYHDQVCAARRELDAA